MPERLSDEQLDDFKKLANSTEGFVWPLATYAPQVNAIADELRAYRNPPATATEAAEAWLAERMSWSPRANPQTGKADPSKTESPLIYMAGIRRMYEEAADLAATIHAYHEAQAQGEAGDLLLDIADSLFRERGGGATVVMDSTFVAKLDAWKATLEGSGQAGSGPTMRQQEGGK